MDRATKQIETAVPKNKQGYYRQDRRCVQLPISDSLYRKFRKRARAERRSFTAWLLTIAERELRSKPSL
jgi:hypothetical protein